MKSKTIYMCFAVLLIFTYPGCKSAAIVSGNELMELTKHWQEPKVAVWYYMGTKENFYYFAFNDLGFYNNKYYKVNIDDLHIADPYPFTTNRKKWRVMHWGPHAHGYGKEE